MESYIVRIYRGDEGKSRKIVGIIEGIDSEEKRAFENIDDLWRILTKGAAEGNKRKSDSETVTGGTISEI